MVELWQTGMYRRVTVYGSVMDASLGGHGRPGSELDEAVLGALFSESTVGLHVLDTQLRLVRFNTAARYVQAFALEEALGLRPQGMGR